MRYEHGSHTAEKNIRNIQEMMNTNDDSHMKEIEGSNGIEEKARGWLKNKKHREKVRNKTQRQQKQITILQCRCYMVDIFIQKERLHDETCA